MKLKIFTVYDSAVEAYLQPFYLVNKGEALRSFADTVNDTQSKINHHAHDFTLFEIGEWDNSNAQISLYETKISLGSANEFLKNNNSN